jgi:hypothetical protein
MTSAISVSAGDTDSDKQFKLLDANNDGFISKTELTSVKRLAARWDNLDANKDGKIEKAEFAALNKPEDFIPVEEEHEPIGAAPAE